MVCRANDVPWSARNVLKELEDDGDMQQILAGMNELNERVQNAEARATEAEQHAQATQQELVRSQAGVKGMGKGAAVPPQQEQGIGTFASKYQPQPCEGEAYKWRENGLGFFRSWSGRFFGGALAEIYEHIEGHRNCYRECPTS